MTNLYERTTLTSDEKGALMGILWYYREHLANADQIAKILIIEKKLGEILESDFDAEVDATVEKRLEDARESRKDRD